MIVTEYMENGSLDTFLRVRSSFVFLFLAHPPGLSDWRSGWFLLLSLMATVTPARQWCALGSHLSSRHQLQGIMASSPEWHCKGRGTCLSGVSEVLGGQEVGWGDKREALGLEEVLSQR